MQLHKQIDILPATGGFVLTYSKPVKRVYTPLVIASSTRGDGSTTSWEAVFTTEVVINESRLIKRVREILAEFEVAEADMKASSAQLNG